MRLVCPACGAAASAEAWGNDAEMRQAMRVVAEMPEAVSRRALAYLALFRPASGKGLRWATALRLLAELDRLVREPYVQWEGRPACKNSANAWGLAIDRVVEHAPRKLPLKSHGYLRAVAYEIADELDRAAETRRNQAEAAGGAALRAADDPNFKRLDPEWMRKVWDEKRAKRAQAKEERE